MQIKEFESIFKENLKEFKLGLDTTEYKNFFEYMNLLIEWNEKINLTAITKPEDIIVKHFTDSLTIIKYINEDSKVIDIGTGAGFPGIPIKIVKKNIKLTLLDAVNKKILFLNDVISKTNLDHVETIHGRAEDYGQNEKYREKFDVCTSRAVAPLNILLEYMLPFVKENGICICMKGPEIREELLMVDNTLKKLGGKVENIENFSLSHEENQRNIIIVRKTAKTPKIYPRKAGIPRKKPL